MCHLSMFLSKAHVTIAIKSINVGWGAEPENLHQSCCEIRCPSSIIGNRLNVQEGIYRHQYIYKFMALIPSFSRFNNLR